MSIIPYDNRLLGPLHESLGRWFHEPLFAHDPSNPVWFPAVDVAETDKGFTITADLPDVDREAIDVRVQNSMLTIKGSRESDSTADESGYHRRERSFGKFSRSFGLPENTDAERIMAEHNNGVLKVHIPKVEPKKAPARRVSVA